MLSVNLPILTDSEGRRPAGRRNARIRLAPAAGGAASMLSAVRGPPRRENCVAVATALQKPKRAEILVLVLRADHDRGLRADRDRGLLAAHDGVFHVRSENCRIHTFGHSTRPNLAVRTCTFVALPCLEERN